MRGVSPIVTSILAVAMVAAMVSLSFTWLQSLQASIASSVPDASAIGAEILTVDSVRSDISNDLHVFVRNLSGEDVNTVLTFYFRDSSTYRVLESVRCGFVRIPASGVVEVNTEVCGTPLKSTNLPPEVFVEVSTSTGYVGSSKEMQIYTLKFMYERPITVSNPGSTDLAEYPILITLDTQSLISSGKMSPDCSDIRFADSDRVTELQYWIEDGCNTPNTRIWVKIPSLPAGTDKNIYMYYGATNAKSKSVDMATMFSYSSPRLIGYVVSDRTANTTGLIVMSLCNDNEVIIGSNHYFLDAMQSVTVSTADLEINTPIYAKCLIQAEGAGTYDDIIVPISWAGTEFIYGGFRDGSDRFCMLAPFGDAWVEIYDGGVLEWNGTVTSTGLCVTNDITNGNALRIVSDVPILVSYYGAGGSDSFPLYPATSGPLYGISSAGTVVGSVLPAFCEYNSSSSASTSTFTISANGQYSIGGGSDGTGPALAMECNVPVGAIQQADSDGTEATSFLPIYEMTTDFGSAQPVEYIAVATSYSDAECSVYDDSGALVDSFVATGYNTAYKICFNCNDTTYISGPWRVHCTRPVYAYYEEDIYAEETQVLGWKQMRQYVYPEPSVVIGSEVIN